MKKYISLFFLLALLACGDDASDISPELSGTGQGGSLTRFLIVNNQLLVLDRRTIKQYEIQEGGEFEFLYETEVGSDLETLFYNEPYVFVGSSSAVHFLSFSSFGQLQKESSYVHLTACDPVVAQNGIAYSTLRTSGCRFGGDEVIDVIDFSDIESPQILKSYSSIAPYGLALNEQFLFVCENGGINMYDRGDAGELVLFDQIEIEGHTPVDLILRGDLMIVRTKEGILNLGFDSNGEMRVLAEINAE